uniref:Uncharacterized protein n=1 Tax=Arundo donax TaxID=35708 RepID=A0A0A9BR10_ARUDO
MGYSSFCSKIRQFRSFQIFQSVMITTAAASSVSAPSPVLCSCSGHIDG